MTTQVVCPHCSQIDRQVRAGLNGGNQRYKCGYCGRRYTPVARTRGYSPAIRRRAIEMHAKGTSLRHIADQLGVTAASVSKWVRSVSTVETLPEETKQPPAIAEPSTRAYRRPTILDVADLAGVSVSSVSNYLNNKGRMSIQTNNRIKSAIASLHFAPNFHVRAMREHRTRILGAVLFGLGDLDEHPTAAIAPAILTGIDRAANTAEHDVLLFTGWSGYPGRLSADRLLGGHIDGLLWVAPAMSEPIMETVAEAGVPLVVLLSRHVPNNVGYINVDNLAAMELLVSHLVKLGRSRIAFLGPVLPSSNWIDRRDGYRIALAKFGLKRDPNLEAIAPNNNYWEWAYYEEKIDEWLAGSPLPDAIVVAEDGFARQVIEHLARRGVRIPEDIAITGFNDSPFASAFAGGLTTIRQDFRKIGQSGAERLIALVEGAPVEECRITLPPELIIRRTTTGANP